MRKNRLAPAALVVGVSLLLVACGSDDGKSGGGGSLDLVIGDSAPLSGDLADYGPPTEKATDLAVEQINAAIEKAGVDQSVSIVHEDNCGGSDQQCALQATRKLITSDKASCVVGPWASADVIPTAQSVAIPEKTLLVLPASTAGEITELEDGPGYINRTAYPDFFQGPALANYVAKALGGAAGKTVNVGSRNDTYGTGLTDAFVEAWQKQGGKIGAKVIYDVDLPNYDSEADEITSGDPDGTVIIDFPETYNKVGPALVRTGKLDPKTTFFPDGNSSPGVIESAGEEATVGVRGTVPGTVEEAPQTKAFDKAFKAADPKNVERIAYDAQSFDSAVLCYLAAAAAGSTDGTKMAEKVREISGPPGKKVSWLELDEAIEALEQGEDVDYQGVAGPIDLDENGDPSAAVYDIYEFQQDGTSKIVDEVNVKTPAK